MQCLGFGVLVKDDEKVSRTEHDLIVLFFILKRSSSRGTTTFPIDDPDSLRSKGNATRLSQYLEGWGRWGG